MLEPAAREGLMRVRRTLSQQAATHWLNAGVLVIAAIALIVWPYVSKRNYVEVSGIVIGHGLEEGTAPRSNARVFHPFLKVRYQSSAGEVITNFDPEIYLDSFRSPSEARRAAVEDFPIDSSVDFFIDRDTGHASAARRMTERSKFLVVLVLGGAGLFVILALRSE